MSTNILSCYFWGKFPGMQWVEAKDAAKYPKMHRTASTSKNHPVQKVISTKVKNGGAKTYRPVIKQHEEILKNSVVMCQLKGYIIVGLNIAITVFPKFA